MLRTLKILCILLKVLMPTRTAFVSKDLEDVEYLEDVEDVEYEHYITHNQDIPKFQFIDVRDYISSNIESVQNYSEIVTVKNEVALQEGTIPSLEGIPSEPTFPRAFVEFGNRLNKTDIFVTFRWNKPEFTNTTIQKYRVQYWFIENLKKIQTVDIIPANNMILQHKVYKLKPDTMYYFKVQAHNEVGTSIMLQHVG
ncbi:unnamed protein product [Lasius platythorax]|uniref:Fibronectin type-III domain-containing protein n=1 Tax=Lasius platythorax TaxID=488582 RepID=A0AAV2P7Q5_9HYME